MEKIRKQNAITLIVLVVTIIVLLILAGVTIATLMGNNGLLTRAQEAKQRTEVSENEEEGMLNDLNNMMENYTQTTEGFDGEVNSPKLSSGMIPVYYDETNKVWKKADKENKDNSWYKYGTVEKENKKWANIVTVKEEVRNEYMESEVGTEIKMEDITTMFVWIPRYSYEIEYDEPGNKNAGGTIHVSFLQGNTNKEENGEETEKIVHPGFEMNGVQLKGIWIAKFEASGINKNGENVGNRENGSSSLPSTEGAYVTVKPSVPSWREINIGESQYQSMKISTDKEHYGLTSANSHLIKNVEWGAVAYLCYSEYGEVPQINACGSYNGTYYYDLYTGAGPQADGNMNKYEYDSTTFESNYAYNTANGKLASTTGNETGIYDMSGGANEYIAGYNLRGTSILNPIVGESKYWDIYADLDSVSLNGDGISETRSGTWAILVSACWYADHFESTIVSQRPRYIRGGDFDDGDGAGLFSIINLDGKNYAGVSFRVVIPVI